jgi:hypothetical protein
MKTILAVFILLVFTVCLAYSEELKKLNLDNASLMGTTIQTDTKIKAEGTGSVKIATQWPTTICLKEIEGLSVENTKLLYKAKVKSDLDGTAYLEMWVHVGGGQYFSRGMNDMVSRKTDWKTIQTPFLLQKGQKADKVTLNLVINGKGTVWVDDVALSGGRLK